MNVKGDQCWNHHTYEFRKRSRTGTREIIILYVFKENSIPEHHVYEFKGSIPERYHI